MRTLNENELVMELIAKVGPPTKDKKNILHYKLLGCLVGFVCKCFESGSKGHQLQIVLKDID